MPKEILLINKKTAFVLTLAVFLFVLDRIFKFLVMGGYTHEVFAGLFKINLAKNYGIAFSLPLGGLGLDLLIFIILIGLMVFMYKSAKKYNFGYFSASFVVFLGAVSNLIDRLSVGCVIDYLDLSYFTVFNLADVMIFCGVLAIVVLGVDKKV